MRRLHLRWPWLGLAVLGISGACAQGDEPQVAAEAPDVGLANEAQLVARFLSADRPAATLASLRVSSQVFTEHTGVTHLRMGQELEGVRVVGSYVKASVDALGQVTHVIDRLATLPAHFDVARGGEAAALRATLAHLGHQAAEPVTLPSEEANVLKFALGNAFLEPARVERIAYVAEGGAVRAGYLVETWSARGNQLHETVVDARGKVVSSELRTNTDRYNVFLEDPGKGAQTLVNGPAAGGTESPNGWLGTGTQRTIAITGNNVKAYLDADGNNAADSGGTTVTGGNFTAVADLTQQPSTATNRAVATQQLFYFNNRLHDLLYRHGFNEAAGNFQTSNFGRGGRGSDAVLAEVQDGSGTDNANFSTPSDGRAPRMQMYLFSGPDPDSELRVTSPAAAAGSYKARAASFGPKLTTTGITGSIVLVNDGTGTTSDACETISTSLTGKVALIDRGTCEFGIKVANAQAAGATAVIVANNQGGTDTFSMGTGSSTATIRIPAVMIGQNDGNALRTVASLSGTVRKLAVAPLMLDGDLDADIVFHEYGHGLSWRMIGSMSGRMSGALGEGVSDGLAILIDGDDKMGEYAGSRANGIRRYPYAGYPLTYADVTGAEVHDDGELYGAIVWRMKELFNAAGVSDDELLGYYVDGMNYTPSAPAYEDMRDGLVAAVNAAGTGHECLIWEAFAQFGVGVGADGRVSGSSIVVTESYQLPAACN